MTKSSKKPMSSNKRLAGVLLLVCLFLLSFLVVAIVMMVEKGNDYSHRVLTQATGGSQVVLSTPGNILDKNGIYLATSKKVYRLILDPKVNAANEKKYPGTLEKTCALASEAFGLDRAELKAAFLEDTERSYLRFNGGLIFSEEEVSHYQELVADFQQEKEDIVKKIDRGELPETAKIEARVSGIWFEEEYRREYPLDTLLSKTIGFTNADSSAGLLGLELYYDDILRGENGREYTYIDEDGNITKEVTAAEDGYTLVTSLDSNVARILQEEIALFMETTGANRVNCLVLNPNNGEIVAMASDTDFDLNDTQDLTRFFTEEEIENPASTFLLQEAFQGKLDVLESMTPEEQRMALIQQVQLNYCVSGTFEPGSTGKGLTLAAAIETGAIDTEETFFCDGEIEVEGHIIHCHMDSYCGDLTCTEAFGRSCNVSFVRIVNSLGNKLFAKYQEIFNLGQKTNVDLPGEANTSTLIYREEGLGEIELATGAFGQGYNLTMVQMAAAYASLINGGNYYEPHVVTAVLDSKGNTVREVEPTLVRHTISAETSDYMREALRYVITNGTASGMIQMPGYTLIAKTGAAEKLPRGTGKYIVSLISASSEENPQFILYVVVDEPHVEDQSMSRPAVELSHQILNRLYPYYRIYPTE